LGQLGANDPSALLGVLQDREWAALAAGLKDLERELWGRMVSVPEISRAREDAIGLESFRDWLQTSHTGGCAEAAPFYRRCVCALDNCLRTLLYPRDRLWGVDGGSVS
jgi:hypothetical protein